jgi:hypothetical protein
VNPDIFAGNVNDPITLNKYLYCKSNPIAYIDYSGYATLQDVLSANMIMSILVQYLTNTLLRQISGEYDTIDAGKDLLIAAAIGAAGGFANKIAEYFVRKYVFGKMLSAMISAAAGSVAMQIIYEIKLLLEGKDLSWKSGVRIVTAGALSFVMGGLFFRWNATVQRKVPSSYQVTGYGPSQGLVPATYNDVEKVVEGLGAVQYAMANILSGLIAKVTNQKLFPD